MEEQHLRILTRIYNGQRYLPSLLPPHDEVYSETNNMPSGPGFNGFQSYDLDASIDYSCISLEPEFINNYSTWLEKEVFNADDDDHNDDEREHSVHLQPGSDTPIPSTPCPSNNHQHQFTSEELTLEINKLYIQELNAEFKPATPITLNSVVKKSDEASWDSPPVPKKLTPLFRYDGNESSMTYLRPSTWHQQEEEQKDEHWQMHTLDELLSRLFIVEENATEKWLATADNNKPDMYRFRLFEQELLYSSSESNTLSSDDDYLQDTTAPCGGCDHHQ